MQFDFKVTTWERVVVDPECEQEIYDAIKSGEITCQEDIFNRDVNVMNHYQVEDHLKSAV